MREMLKSAEFPVALVEKRGPGLLGVDGCCQLTMQIPKSRILHGECVS
jgi:hypothetical protein